MDQNHIAKFVINLRDRADRRSEMECQLRRVGWRAQFSNSERPPNAGGFPSIGARGCFESHLATLKRASAFSSHVLIMEDDLNFAPGFSRLWEDACRALDETNWSIFYPGHLLKESPDGLALIGASQPVMCAHFLMINKSAVAPIIDGLETILSRPPGHPDGGPMHVDGAYTTIRAQNPDLETFVFSPSLGSQRASRSDIADQKIYDRIEALRPVMRKLRRIKQSISAR